VLTCQQRRGISGKDISWPDYSYDQRTFVGKYGGELKQLP